MYVDGEQVRTALGCLLRNAVEAAAARRLGAAGAGRAGTGRCTSRCFVEDSGPGPTAEQRPHLFDPFYSGPQRRSRPGARTAGGLAAGPAAGRRHLPGAGPARRANALRADAASHGGRGGRAEGGVTSAEQRSGAIHRRACAPLAGGRRPKAITAAATRPPCPPAASRRTRTVSPSARPPCTLP